MLFVFYSNNLFIYSFDQLMMSKKDFDRFLIKIDQLNKLIEYVNKYPEKYELFIECQNHNEVVEIAKKWGFEIGKRWGED